MWTKGRACSHVSGHPDPDGPVITGLAPQAVTLRQPDRRTTPDLAGLGELAVRHP
jgi:hypothetical protein